MYYIYIDECGDEGDYNSNSDAIGNSSQFFTLGGIIVRDIIRSHFTAELERIKTDFFGNMVLPHDFRLHYIDLRRKRHIFDVVKHPYDKLKEEAKFQICNRVFSAIECIECSLVSVTIDLDKHCNNYTKPVSAMAYAMYLIQQAVSTENHCLAETKDSQNQAVVRAIRKSIHRIRPCSDIWGCDYCRVKDDKWGMKKHICEGILKAARSAESIFSSSGNKTEELNYFGGS